MLHQWFIVVPKTEEARQSLTSIIASRIMPHLTIKPELVCFHQVANWAYLFSASGNNALYTYDQPYVIAETEGCVVSGLPTLENVYADDHVDLAQGIHDCIKNHDPQWLFSTIGGDWQAAYCNEEKITALHSFSGYQSFCYTNNDLFFAVGNRATLVAQFQTLGVSPTFNKGALSWIYSTTMILGQETPFDGVTKVRPGNYLEYSKTSGPSIKTYRENFYTPLSFSNKNDEAEYLEDAISDLAKRIKWYVSRGMNLQTDLTGGKDSRALLSLLIYSGALDTCGNIQTFGANDNGDVMVARMVTTHLGLSRKHRVTAGDKAAIEFNVEQIASRFPYSPVCYEGQMTPFDAAGCPKPQRSTKVSFMGGGGEIYRQKHYKSFRDVDQIKKQFLNWSYTYNKLGILPDWVIKRQMEFLENESKLLLEQGVLNHHPKFYVDHRLSNWGAAHFQNSQSGAIAALNDFKLARYAFSSDNIGENIHFSIMKQACRPILDIPFLNSNWSSPTAEMAKACNCYHEPLVVPIKKNFPWQFDFYEKYRNVMIRFVLRHIDLFEGWLDETRLSKLLDTPVEPFNSASVKMLMGAVSHVFWLSGCDHVLPVYNDEPYEPQYVGNHSASLPKYASVTQPTVSKLQHEFVRDLAEGGQHTTLLQSIWLKTRRRLSNCFPSN